MRRLPECPCSGFFPYVILNVFFPDLFDMADHDVEQRHGNNRHDRRIIDHQHDVAVHQLGAGRIRPFGINKIRERIEPLDTHQQIAECLDPHRQAFRFQRSHLGANDFKQFRIGAVRHIADADVRIRHAADLIQLRAEMTVPDPAPDQRHVVQKHFDKTVFGTTQRLVLVRLIHTSCGIRSGIDQDTSVKSIYKNSKNA